jgi:hypothetical protein
MSLENQILEMLSKNKEICFEYFFDLDFKSDSIFEALQKLEKEGRVKFSASEMAYVSLIK